MSHLLLSIQHINVNFLNNRIFTGLNFTVSPGQHWALVGKSGSGKSALLQTIAGRFNVTGGEIHYHFFDDYKKSHHTQDGLLTYHKLVALIESKHHFRNLSNTTDFYYQQRYNSSDSEDTLTVEEYLKGINHLPDVADYWTIDRAIETMRLTPLLDEQLIKLSNGETKRLMIAAALLKHPALLLLDNPLTGLDIQTRSYFNEILKDITSSGITVIMATQPKEIPDVITHVAVFDDGRISAMLKKDQFDPASVIMDSDANNVDQTAIKDLLDLKPIPAFEDIVKMQQVTVKYADKTILNRIDWHIKQGERWALLGPNGAGKSTLLSLINGDNPQAYANNIILFDKKRGSGESIWDIKQKIGFVSPELYQYFPVDNNCLQVIESGFYDTLGLFRPSQTAKAEVASKWMKVLGIEKYSRTLLKNIPASAQRLCLLARALVKGPSLLILDEPCQGMDPQQQHHFKQVIDTLCHLSSITLIYVTHYQDEIPDSVTKVLRLDKGSAVI
jgi:molybdate transport system ATP-binding protein